MQHMLTKLSSLLCNRIFQVSFIQKKLKNIFEEINTNKATCQLISWEKDTSIVSILVMYIYNMLNLVVSCFLGMWKSTNVTNSQLLQVTLCPHKRVKVFMPYIL